MLRHFFILCIAACSLWSAVVGLFVVACSGGGSGGGGETEGTVKLFLGKLQVPMFDSISVDVSGEGMANIHISKKSLDENLNIEGIQQGKDRKFEVKIYADSGTLVQKGEAVADITAGESITIKIPLTALVGFLKLEIPLGIANYSGVHSGKLFLDDIGLVFNIKIENGKGTFNTNSLPLNENLNIRIELRDASGKLLFTGSKNLSLSSILQTEIIQLQSYQGSVTLQLIASSNGPLQILATLPMSTSRSPKNGDLFFTEIFATPKTGGKKYEYMEIYNATFDTLELSGCRIARNRSTTAVSYVLDMPENLTLLPMEFLFFGGDSVRFADFNYGTIDLSPTAQSLGFFCDTTVVDSIYYSTSESNPFPLKTGIAMQLPLENYETRMFGSSWCLGSSPGEDAICP